jgi:carbonic anhydrase
LSRVLRMVLIVTLSMTFVAAFTSTRLDAQGTEHEKYVSPWKTRWDYRGPRGADHWSHLDPAYAACNEGKEQSPIDIHDAVKTDLPALQFDSKNGPVRYVINNGYTIRVNYLRGNENYLVAGGQRYELIQFHFHRPSEESISGKTYPMEAHLMYETVGGKVAGVTVLIKSGHPNSAVQKLWEHMPNTEGQNEVPGVEINPSDLLPRNTRAYFMYMGSVTAPPCTEGVTWFVIKNPIELSENQINAFAKLYPNDARPVQPLNGRVVRESR